MELIFVAVVVSGIVALIVYVVPFVQSLYEDRVIRKSFRELASQTRWNVSLSRPSAIA